MGGVVRISALALLLALVVPAWGATPKQIKEVAADLVCLCGSCNRESLATCICTDFAVPEREAIGRRLDQGQTKEQIVAAYVADYGEMALAVPPASGFNILAWVTPFALLLGGVFLVRRVLMGWRRPASRGPPASDAGSSPAEDERQRLERDLERYDD